MSSSIPTQPISHQGSRSLITEFKGHATSETTMKPALSIDSNVSDDPLPLGDLPRSNGMSVPTLSRQNQDEMLSPSCTGGQSDVTFKHPSELRLDRQNSPDATSRLFLPGEVKDRTQPQVVGNKNSPPKLEEQLTGVKIETGLTPFLQNTPRFPDSAFASENEVVEEADDSMNEQRIGSSPPRGKVVDMTRSSNTLQKEFCPTKPRKKKHSFPHMKISPPGGITSSPPDNETMRIPTDDYAASAISAKWDDEDARVLISLFDNAERHKWSYISDCIYAESRQRIPMVACQRKFYELFGVAENSTTLGSSVHYIAFKSGFRAIKDLRAATEDPEYTAPQTQ